MQEKLREIKERNKKEADEPESSPTRKKYKTPKNSRFFAKIRQQTEVLITPKTNRKSSKPRKNNSNHLQGDNKDISDSEEDNVPVEYEACL